MENCELKLENGKLPISTPEEQGIHSRYLLVFLAAVDADPELELHSFYLLRHGKQILGATAKPFSPHSPHRIYSAAKGIQALGVMFLIQEGKLSLDDRCV